MSFSYAVFLDAGFLKVKLRRPGGPPVTSQQIKELVDEVGQHSYLSPLRLHRAYFYDARPLEEEVTRPDGTTEDLARTPLARINKGLHKAIEELPFFSLRFGELSYQGWKFNIKKGRTREFPVTLNTARDLKLDVAQKGVDMRIGLDMASLTLKQHVKVIALVTGDSDFVPAMKFARREGSQVLLFTLGHGIKPALAEHADLVVTSQPGHIAN